MSTEQPDDRPLLQQLKLANVGLPTAVPGRLILYVSATHVDNYRRCPKLYYGGQVLRMRKPDQPSTILGGKVHKVLERYGKFRELPDQSTPEGRIALAGEHSFPDPDEVEAGTLLLESEFVFQPDGMPVPFYGLIDKLDLKRIRLRDYKTTSDFKWAKSSFELQTNAQAVIYGSYAVSIGVVAQAVDGRTYIDFGHDYLRTRGAAQHMPVDARLYTDKLKINLDNLVAEVQEMLAVTLLPFDQVPHNADPDGRPTGCGDYGGCHMKGFCMGAGVPVNGPSNIEHLLAGLFALPSFASPPASQPQEIPQMALPTNLNALLAQRTSAAAKATPLNELQAEVGGTSVAPATKPAVSVPPTGPTVPGVAGAAAPPTTPAPAAAGAKFPTLPARPAPAPVVTNVVPQAQVTQTHASVNPPDGFPRDVPGTVDGPEMPKPVASDLQAEVEARALQNQKAQAEAKAAQKAAKPAAALPGKRAKKATPDVESVAQSPAQKAWPIELFVEGYEQGIYDIARKDAAFQAAVGEFRLANEALMALTEQAPQIEAQVRELETAGAEDQADDVKAAHAKALSRAERAMNKSRDAAVTAAEAACILEVEAVKQAQEAQAAAEAARDEAQAAEAGAGAPTAQPAAQPKDCCDCDAPKLKLSATGGARFLYIGARPQRQQVVLWEDFIHPYTARAEAARKTGYFRLIQHEANTAVIAEVLADLRSGKVKSLPSMVLGNYSSLLHAQFVEALTPYFDDVVR